MKSMCVVYLTFYGQLNIRIALDIAEVVNNLKKVQNKYLPRGDPKAVALAYTPFRAISTKYDLFCVAMVEGNEEVCEELVNNL